VSKRSLLLILAALLLAILTFSTAFTLLPPAPIAPTPTWPLGIELPDKLPRIPVP
jgi:hypothetical protein